MGSCCAPVAVSTFLEPPEFQFHVVIFDEASQVLPWDAIGAVYRGRQLVVAGDQKQLPPYTFLQIAFSHYGFSYTGRFLCSL